MGTGKKRGWNGNFVISLLAFFFLTYILNTEKENKVNPIYPLLDFNTYLLMTNLVLSVLSTPRPLDYFQANFRHYTILSANI